MVDVAEGAGPVDRLHNLLLAMTGRVDDDGINSARELLGIGQPGAAAEYLTGCLLAGRIPVNASEQYHLRRILDETRSTQVLADRVNVVDSVPADEHRFGEPAEDDGDLLAALAPVAARLQGVRGLWCATRTTPAGASYGAVPRRILLAEVSPDGSTTAVAYQLIEALRRAGINCSVDVFDSGAELPEYHRDALAAAHRVHLDAPSAPPAERPAAREERPAAREERPAAREERPAERPAEQPRRVVEERPAEPERSIPQPARPVSRPEPEPALAQAAEAQAEASAMRVPPAVDAKLTDRERNLLRKLHEELAQREQDRSGSRRQNGASNGEEGWTSTMPGGTGGFPPIGAAPVNNQAYTPQQQRS
ncbi:hypothetical protein SAMN05216215_1017154 [Saccharopolyspora shandongensis]|uniref:Uncharacterized protein n=1 Tax=Saccharopolyspora shandongensis TaxID=418495 RepID=A0A1H3FTJ7_9PSEU|nr:hypothetical protein [Saccharopolyspora shandongensis]SDX94135.1 hypothetical protein SAMN05216215_1017154 [Saccharopolyspora shandongensis]